MEFKTRIGGPEAMKIAKRLGLGNVGDETDINTMVWFKHIQEGIYHYVEIGMEI